MSFEFENKLQDWIGNHKIETAIDSAESKLKSLPYSGFNQIIGKNLLHHKDELTTYIEAFYNKSKKNYRKLNGNFLQRLFSKNSDEPQRLQSISCELTSYSISDTINFDLFALSKNLGLENLEWLADFEFNSLDHFAISGLEDLEEVYLTYYDQEQYQDKNLESSQEICEYLITLRVQELFQQALKGLKDKNDVWGSLPIYVFAHDSDLTYRTI